MARYYKKLSKRRLSIVDDVSYVAIFLGIVMTLPQVIKIWVERSGEGVSVITWVSYTILGIFWTYYGFVHKEKPIIIGNLLGLVLNLAVVVSLIVVR